MQQWRRIAEAIVGVIDLMGGQPVHARGGDRRRYQPIGIGGGGVEDILRHYRRLDIERFYLADLDAIESSPRCYESSQSVMGRLRSNESIWIDSGWRVNEPIAPLEILLRDPNVTWIVATETCSDWAELLRLSEVIDPRRLAIGLDFRGGQFCGRGTPEQWIQTASRVGIRNGLILEFDDVGSGTGTGGATGLRKLTAMRPDWTWVSGGGIRRPTDVKRFQSAGCDGVLVATALMPAAMR